MLSPFNIIGQTISTDSSKVSVAQGFLAHIEIGATSAAAASNNSVLSAKGLTTAAQVITTGITNPSVPRNISITGSATGIAGNVVIKGTNYNGDSISETIALSGTSTVEGAKAFKTVTEIDLPIKTNASGDSISVGLGEILGLPYKLSKNTVLEAFVDNTKESTVPTVVTNASTLESNTIKLNTALSGKAVDIYLIV